MKLLKRKSLRYNGLMTIQKAPVVNPDACFLVEEEYGHFFAFNSVSGKNDYDMGSGIATSYFSLKDGDYLRLAIKKEMLISHFVSNTRGIVIEDFKTIEGFSRDPKDCYKEVTKDIYKYQKDYDKALKSCKKDAHEYIEDIEEYTRVFVTDKPVLIRLDEKVDGNYLSEHNYINLPDGKSLYQDRIYPATEVMEMEKCDKAQMNRWYKKGLQKVMDKNVKGVEIEGNELNRFFYSIISRSAPPLRLQKSPKNPPIFPKKPEY